MASLFIKNSISSRATLLWNHIVLIPCIIFTPFHQILLELWISMLFIRWSKEKFVQTLHLFGIFWCRIDEEFSKTVFPIILIFYSGWLPLIGNKYIFTRWYFWNFLFWGWFTNFKLLFLLLSFFFIQFCRGRSLIWIQAYL